MAQKPLMGLPEFKRLKTILRKVENEFLFEKISSRIFFHDPSKGLTAE